MAQAKEMSVPEILKFLPREKIDEKGNLFKLSPSFHPLSIL